MMNRIQCSGAVPATISPMTRNAQLNNRSGQEYEEMKCFDYKIML